MKVLPRLKSNGFTIFAIINPIIHKKEEIEAITSIFDGEIESIEREVERKSQRHIVVKRLFERKYIDDKRMVT